MDIFGSALISPSVSWAINRNIVTSSNHVKRAHENDDEETSEPDQPERSGKYSNYQTGGESWKKPFTIKEKQKIVNFRFFIAKFRY